MPEITLGVRTVGEWFPPYVIAEIGVNHQGSIDLARRLIDLAREGGADAAKFQTYKADKIASRNSPAYWDTTKEPAESQHRLFQRYDRFGEEEYCALAEHCEAVGIDFLSTPFDLEAVEFLAPLMAAFKVASADLTNVPLLRAVASHGKPILLSTGAATLGEIDIALDELRSAGGGPVSLLHCVLNYPTPDRDAHLAMIRGLRRAHPDLVIGYSDHTLPDPQMTALVTSYLLGARVIEKHFTHDKSLPGNDHYHAMDVDDLRNFRQRIETVRTLLGKTETKRPLAEERPARRYARRSIVLSRDVEKGEVLDETALVCKRPGTGIGAAFWDQVVGRRAALDLPEDHVLSWADLRTSEEEQ